MLITIYGLRILTGDRKRSLEGVELHREKLESLKISPHETCARALTPLKLIQGSSECVKTFWVVEGENIKLGAHEKA